ncbi:GYDIA family GHMP kinase [Salinimicrobium sp. GXAS 041]|uniref:GYDIA family GHMP kinase n=1 Tax=Salinimicrobium sp. GXAS 041 TaxID=3400806 RepID=UPI003C71DD09
MKEFYSNGKLLLSGEFVVLDGATALAVPTKFGQSLQVEKLKEPLLHWKSINHEGQTWFKASYSLKNGILETTSENEIKEVQKRLLNILTQAAQLNPDVLSGSGFKVTAKLDFPQEWGLGSSSTLVNNIANWFEIDAFELLSKTFGGSGYDIASAQNDTPVTYSLTPNGRTIFTADFDPAFADELFFVHLNRKQNSRESIRHYKNQSKGKLKEAVDKISGLTHQLISAETITEYELLLEIHETVISQVIDTPKIKTQLFRDYPRTIKSLGGWGGDFILATGKEKEKDYFRNKGYNTILDYREMVL